MANPTNSSEAFLSNKDTTARMAYLLDALLGLAGGSFGAAKTNNHGTCAATDTPTVVSAVPGAVVDINIGNISAAWSYLKLYNKVAAPTNADTPVQVFPIPPGGGLVKTVNFAFTLGIGLRIVKGSADNDNTAQVAGDVVWNLNFTS